ncbi:MAG: trypsin-like peptidase domain-containing protein [Planctomycetes bacterium]|nr:trypsin-like peptidase domain-containing protein [Planctomycetota bacterium]
MRIEKEAAVPSRATLERDLLLPTVRISCGGAWASGTVIACTRDPDGSCVARILTAGHAVANGRTSGIQVSLFGPGQGVVEEVLAVRRAACEEIDITLLEARLSVPAFPARIGDGSIGAGLFDEVWAVGCPLGSVPVPTSGRIVCTNRAVDGEVFWMFSAQTIFGNSGGGVYAADTRRLVGIARGVFGYGPGESSAVPHLGVLVPADRIASWLDEVGYGGILGEGDVRPTSFLRPGALAR